MTATTSLLAAHTEYAQACQIAEALHNYQSNARDLVEWQQSSSIWESNCNMWIDEPVDSDNKNLLHTKIIGPNMSDSV